MTPPLMSPGLRFHDAARVLAYSLSMPRTRSDSDHDVGHAAAPDLVVGNRAEPLHGREPRAEHLVFQVPEAYLCQKSLHLYPPQGPPPLASSWPMIGIIILPLLIAIIGVISVIVIDVESAVAGVVVVIIIIIIIIVIFMFRLDCEGGSLSCYASFPGDEPLSSSFSFSGRAGVAVC